MDWVMALIDEDESLSPQYYDIFGEVSYQLGRDHLLSIHVLGKTHAHRRHPRSPRHHRGQGPDPSAPHEPLRVLVKNRRSAVHAPEPPGHGAETGVDPRRPAPLGLHDTRERSG